MRSTVSSNEKTREMVSSPKGGNDFSVRLKKFWKRNREGWMFVSPLVIGLGIFTLYPMIQSLIWSFFNYTGSQYYYPVGFGNYVHLFTVDPVFWKVVRNTCFYAFLSVPIVLVSSYLLATLVNLPLKGVGFFRVVYYLPVVIPGVVSGILWSDMFSAYGVFNSILDLFGTHSQFFENPNSYKAISSIFLMNLWSVGGGMILWLSAFKAIPGQLYEAAKIDGAGVLQRFFHVTIPMSMPMIFFNVITMLIGTFQYNGTLTYAYEGRGYQNSMYMYGVFIYNEAFVQSKFGYGSALSWLLVIFLALLTGALFAIRKKLYMGDDN